MLCPSCRRYDCVLHGGGDTPSVSADPIGALSDASLLELDDLSRIDLEDANQGAHDVVTAAIQDDRASIEPTTMPRMKRELELDCDDGTTNEHIRLNQSALSDSPSGSPPTGVQPGGLGSASGSVVSPHPIQEVRAATEVAPNKSHPPSGVDELIKLREKCQHFRVLVLGRANAGKTTLLKAVCGATGDPERIVAQNKREENVGSGLASQGLLSPTAGRGEHDITTQLVFPSNPGFVFHDSRGFEAGSDEELNIVTEFIRITGNGREVSQQLHAIWYCIPTDNEARLLSGPEQELLRVCGTGPVPLVVIFTKFDSLEAKAFHELKGVGLTRQQAQQGAPQHAYAEFQRCHLSHLFGEKHPKYICLKKMHKEQNVVEIQGKMAELIQQTMDAIDVDALKLLLVSVQRNNLQLTIDYAVRDGGMERLARGVSVAGNTVTAQHVQQLVKTLLPWFGYMYKADNLETDRYLEEGGFDKVAKEYHEEIHTHIAPLVGSLPGHLHVPVVAIGILIVTAQLFWHAHGQRPTTSQIGEVISLYLTSGKADAVRAQVEAELGNLMEYYNWEHADVVIKIVMENQLGH